MKASKVPYIVTTLGILLAALLVYSFVYTPKINAAKALDQQRQTVAEEDSSLQQRAQLVAAKIKDLPGVESKVDEFSKSVPSNPSQRELFAAILDAGATAGVRVTGINPAAPAPVPAAGSDGTAPAPAPAGAAGAAVDPALAGPLYQVGLTINASGDQQNLLVFMQKVESMKRPFTTTEMTLAKADGTSNLTMTGNSFMASPLTAPQVQAAAPADGAQAPADAKKG